MQNSGRGRNIKHLGRVAATISATVFLLVSGCSQSNSSAAKDPTARAFFNHETGEIVRPLDEYDLEASPANIQLLRRVLAIAIGKCMSALGYKYSAAHIADSPKSNPGSREYGLWNVEAARKYGHSFPKSSSRSARESDRLAGGEAWVQARKECSQKLPPEIKSLIPDKHDSNSTDTLVSRLRGDAHHFAKTDPAWAAARVPWEECLRKSGLEPQSESNGWSTVQFEAMLKNSTGGTREVTPEDIQIAYTEAKCNMDSGMAQNLANLEAAYQKPLIDKNQAALNKLKVRMQERLAFARNYIATNG